MSRPDPLLEFQPERISASIAPSVAPIHVRRDKPARHFRPAPPAIDPAIWSAWQTSKTPDRLTDVWSRVAGVLRASFRVNMTAASLAPFVCGAVIGACVVWLASGSSRPSSERSGGSSSRGQLVREQPRSTPPIESSEAPAVVAAAPHTIEVSKATVEAPAVIAPKLVTASPEPRRVAAVSQLKPVVVPEPERPRPNPSVVAPFVGAISVASEPEGADVSLNGVPVGTTPLVLTDIPAGSRVVLVHLAGYQSWSSGVRVVANQRTNVAATLVPTVTR